jgi:hypothetical protein
MWKSVVSAGKLPFSLGASVSNFISNKTKDAALNSMNIAGLLLGNKPYTKPASKPKNTVHPADQYQTVRGSVPPTTTTSKSSGTSTAGGRVAAPVAQDPWYYSGNDIANKFGIVNDYDTILNELKGVANKKFDTMVTQTKRAEDASVRAARVGYDEYINKLSATKTNAANTGMRKGMQAAEAISQMLLSSQALSGQLQESTDTIYDLGEAQALAEAEAVTQARTQHNQIGQYLAGMGAQFEGNEVNRIAAKLAADAAVKSASINASAVRSGENANYRYIYDMLLKQNQGNTVAATNEMVDLLKTISGYGISKANTEAITSGIPKK